MAHTAAMNDELFRALRDDAGMPEAAAAKVARLIFQQGESAVRADRDAARAVREAERATDREAFAAKDSVTVLQTEMLDVKAAIVRIDKSIEGINATLADMKEMLARTDERMNGIRTLLFAVFLPLHLLTLTALFGLLTRGILWGVAP